VALPRNWYEAARAVSVALGSDSRAKRILSPLFEGTLDLLGNRRGLKWQINGSPCRIVPRHRRLVPRDYDVKVASFLRSHIRPGDVCFDIGANVGAYTLQFAHWVGATGRVVAFEPNPFAREVLARHVALSGYSQRVTIVDQAVSNAVGKAELFFEGVDVKSRLGEANPTIADKVSVTTVATTTLDRFCADSKLYPNWTKIDIEGFELQALQGAGTLLAERDLGLVVEMHAPWDETNAYRRELEQLLQRYTLEPHGLVGQRDPLGEHALVWLKRARA
jgi:FkbM family methyltransferase